MCINTHISRFRSTESKKSYRVPFLEGALPPVGTWSACVPSRFAGQKPKKKAHQSTARAARRSTLHKEKAVASRCARKAKRGRLAPSLSRPRNSSDVTGTRKLLREEYRGIHVAGGLLPPGWSLLPGPRRRQVRRC